VASRSSTYPRSTKVNSPGMLRRAMSPDSPSAKQHSGSTSANSPSTKRRKAGQGSPSSLRRRTASPDSPIMKQRVGSSNSLSPGQRRRAGSMDSPNTRRKKPEQLSPRAQDKSLPRSEGLMGSGEYYDRLSPPLERMTDNYGSPSTYYTPQNGLTSDHHSWYDHGRDYSSLDRRGMSR